MNNHTLVTIVDDATGGRMPLYTTVDRHADYIIAPPGMHIEIRLLSELTMHTITECRDALRRGEMLPGIKRSTRDEPEYTYEHISGRFIGDASTNFAITHDLVTGVEDEHQIDLHDLHDLRFVFGDLIMGVHGDVVRDENVITLLSNPLNETINNRGFVFGRDDDNTPHLIQAMFDSHGHLLILTAFDDGIFDDDLSDEPKLARALSVLMAE